MIIVILGIVLWRCFRINEEVRIEAIIGLSYRKDKRVLSVLCDELKKNTVYDDIIEAAGELGDKTLLPVLDTMLYKFDDNEIITSAIDKLKRVMTPTY